MRVATAALLAGVAVLAAACGGGHGAEQQAKDRFATYRRAENARGGGEGNLNQVFRQISRAADAHDRAGVLAAVVDGKRALETIYRSLEIEIAAADGLAAYGPTRADGRRLKAALRRSRDGTRLVDHELAIASRDPFLDVESNAREISRLSTDTVRISVPAAFARRRAQRAIALTLGVDPPVDVIFDAPQANGGG